MKKILKTRKSDAANYLRSEEAAQTYLEDIFSSKDPALIAHGLAVVVRAGFAGAVSR
ncbi:DNA-binding protein [Aestuariivirga sp.]|uniref:helix-turn-helix domain-containing transcriptional regulator n=1 Tax=Aestuariivirga sp. TaxID=2650926 RepID=UPI0039E30B78